MSFSARNVSQLVVGTTAGTVDDSAAVGTYVINEVAVTPAPAAGGVKNKGVKIMVKTATGVKVSDFIPADASFKAVTMATGVQKAVNVTIASAGGFTNKTFAVVIDKNDHIGSPLNDRFIGAYVVTDGNDKFLDSSGTLTTATAASIAAELRSILAATVSLTGKEFVISGASAQVIVTEAKADFVVGVKDGINLPWKVIAGVKDGYVCTPFFDEAFAQAITPGKPDDLTQLKNVEWFNGGYDKDPYREAGYPTSFPSDSNIAAAGVTSGAYGIFQFYKDRDATNVERQHKQLIVVGAAAAALNSALTAVTT